MSTTAIGRSPFHRENNNKMSGFFTGIVADITDTNGYYQVKVKLSVQTNGDGDGAETTTWARIATFMAGPDRGAFWLPEVDDEVLVGFLNGDINKPIVMGALWNGKDKAIYSNKDASGKVKDANFQGKVEAKKNDLRAIRSRVGHQLIFNDNASEPRVALHSAQKHRIVLDDKGNQPDKIEIYDGKEENYILIDTTNKKITIETKTGDMLLKAKKLFRVEAETIEMKSDKGTSLDVGQNFEMKASSNMSLKASGTGNVESSGAMTVKGSKVNIN